MRKRIHPQSTRMVLPQFSGIKKGSGQGTDRVSPGLNGSQDAVGFKTADGDSVTFERNIVEFPVIGMTLKDDIKSVFRTVM